MRVRLSKAATRDIAEAWDYTAEHRNPDQADKLVDAFHDMFRILDRFPNAGRQRHSLSPGLRSIPVSGFVVFYQIFGGVLEIVRELHGAQDLNRLLSNENATE